MVPWRNLRELFSILRRQQILALLVDWGYRPDGIPVKLFGAWTTLPAGPAVLAAKTGANIALMEVRRTRDGHFAVESRGGVHRARRPTRPTCRSPRSGSPTRWSARSRAAPAQWYSFKPMWPATEDEVG